MIHADRHGDTTAAVALSPRGLAHFAAALEAHGPITIDARALWAAFTTAFPRRPAGQAEREWLLVALRHAEAAGVIVLPPEGGRRWDRVARPALPTCVRRVREARPAPDRSWRTAVWHPALQWVPTLTRDLTAEEVAFLRRVHDGLRIGAFATPAPFKHRSLALTGHEKRLADFVERHLFTEPGRLTLELIGAVREIPPLAWTVLRLVAHPRVLIFENAAPADLAIAVLREAEVPAYDVVVYGGGTPFPSALRRLQDLAPATLHYVGDCDQEGILIATAAAAAACEVGLPALEPAPRLHAAMLAGAATMGRAAGWPHEARQGGRVRKPPRAVVTDARWLGADVRDRVLEIIRAGHRIPEEVLSPEQMRALLHRDIA